MSNCIGVIAAHPDDEVLGCGGTIARHVARGDNVHVLILAQGELSRTTSMSEEDSLNKLADLEKSAMKASDILGVKTLQLSKFPDNRMDSVDRLEVIKEIEQFIQAYLPTRVYTHSPNDVNIDHTITYESVITAARPLPKSCVQEILSFEVLSSSEWRPANSNGTFKPNYFIPLSEEEAQLKLEALSAYHSELREWPHPRSIEACKALSQYRGASVGHIAVEAFEVCRMIAP